jgi:hypothetical protein
VKSAPREELICIFQKTTTIAKDYIGENPNHFLPSPNDKNRNTDKAWFPIPFDPFGARPPRPKAPNTQGRSFQSTGLKFKMRQEQ